jgi:hypothetical protein
MNIIHLIIFNTIHEIKSAVQAVVYERKKKDFAGESLWLKVT